ncbi:MAG TPA: sigma-54 dependent transcriptional regulator [Longimicrobiales bacterium]|nr:sigma-54 dependent transcriptional regulator [Longimicrobiales bacterium]
MTSDVLVDGPNRSVFSRDDEHVEAPEAELGAEAKSGMHVLIVDDEYTLRESCASLLRQEGYKVTVCEGGAEAIELMKRRPVDIALIDLFMEGLSGLEVLAGCLEAKPDTLAIIMTGNPSVESSVMALGAGAWDYLPKPFSATHLQILVGRAAHTVIRNREQSETPEMLTLPRGHSEKVPLLGQSPTFAKVIELARKVAATDASVFIMGESGTGKEMIAQFIHQHSRRASRPMVAVNCAALPETLLESEMFGHVKGAFTGAVRDKPGLLEVANGSSFFLDELTEMPLTIQAKLLRVIQDGVVRRVGSETTDSVVNVRFIAATNRDVRPAVDEGSLRKDLFYRLSVVPIHLPPLRDRPEDIALLAENFLSRYWKRHRGTRAPMPKLTKAALRSLETRPWRGNVRELQNAIEHAVVLLEPGIDIQPEDIPVIDAASSPSTPLAGFDPAGEKYHSARDRILADFEKTYLSWLLDRVGANMSRAAKVAGVDRTTLYRLMEKHGLQRDTVIKAG